MLSTNQSTAHQLSAARADSAAQQGNSRAHTRPSHTASQGSNCSAVEQGPVVAEPAGEPAGEPVGVAATVAAEAELDAVVVALAAAAAAAAAVVEEALCAGAARSLAGTAGSAMRLRWRAVVHLR